MDSFYNCRVINYPTGEHVTIYQKTINKGKKKEELTKTYQKDKIRTEKQENDCKRISLNQTKNRIYKIARSNTWDWFITLTFDRNKNDSSEYDIIVKRLHIFLNNIQKRKCPNLKYLIVPELHADGKHYHFHGLLSDCDGLNFKFSGKYDKKSSKPIFNILNWSYGFTTATRVEDTQKVSSYITKYITKENVNILKEKRRYYASRNIDKPDEIYTTIDHESFLNTYADRVTYCKSLDVKQAHQHINYYELKW